MHTPARRPGRGAARAAVGATAISLAVVALPAPAPAAPTAPYVSELHYDDAGADSGEFVEVTIPPGTTSAGLSVVLHNGAGGAPYATLDVPAVPAPAGAPGAVAVDAPGLRNGSPDGLALVQGGAVVEFLSYEGVVAARSGPAAGTTNTDIGVAEDDVPEGRSLSRLVDTGTGELRWQAAAPSTRGVADPATTRAAGPGDGPLRRPCGRGHGDRRGPGQWRGDAAGRADGHPAGHRRGRPAGRGRPRGLPPAGRRGR